MWLDICRIVCCLLDIKCIYVHPVFGKEFCKLASSVAALSKTFSLNTCKGMSLSRCLTRVCVGIEIGRLCMKLFKRSVWIFCVTSSAAVVIVLIVSLCACVCVCMLCLCVCLSVCLVHDPDFWKSWPRKSFLVLMYNVRISKSSFCIKVVRSRSQEQKMRYMSSITK